MWNFWGASSGYQKKKGRKDTTKERVKARCRLTNKKKEKKESERKQSEIGAPHILT
jgi:hypothetical protein